MGDSRRMATNTFEPEMDASQLRPSEAPLKIANRSSTVIRKLHSDNDI